MNPFSPTQPRLAFSIPTQNDVEQRQLFNDFASHGFDGLQLKGGQYARYLEQPEKFREEWGISTGACAGLICGGSLDENGIAALRGMFHFAAAIGSEMVIFCHGQSRSSISNGDIRSYARQLSQLGEEASGLGVKLSLHNHFDSPVMLREDFELFFDAATPGRVGLTLDTAHLRKSGVGDIAGVVRDFGSWMDNIHLKDFAGGHFKTLGQGEIDFKPVFAALHTIDFRGWLCADEESETGLQESLRASHHFITRGWNDAGPQ